jgi:hypothetical protein
MLTLNPWKKEGIYLMTVQHIIVDEDGYAMLDTQGHAIWQKDTLRVPPLVLKDYLNLSSTLYNDVENAGVVPKRS